MTSIESNSSASVGSGNIAVDSRRWLRFTRASRYAAFMSAQSTNQPKRLHQMDRLEDMGRFPVVVYVGATANVLVEICFVYWLHGRISGGFPAGFVAAVILVACNLLPVVLLRWREGAAGLEDTVVFTPLLLFVG